MKRTEKFSGQMLALLFIAHTAVSAVDVYIPSGWRISNMSTFHKLQHCINCSSYENIVTLLNTDS